MPKFFDLSDLGKVPFNSANYALSIKWYEFYYFLFENLKVESGVFGKAYTFDGIWSSQNVLDGRTSTVRKDLVETNTHATEGNLTNLVFQYYDSNSKTYKNTTTWGQARYSKDNSGEGLTDAFTWNVNSQNIGEGKSQTIYFKFTNGEQVVYFAAYNTVRVSVPVPTGLVPGAAR